MPDLLRRIESAFEQAATRLDSDILEELAQHAEATYDELRAEGDSETDALRKIDQLIDGW